MGQTTLNEMEEAVREFLTNFRNEGNRRNWNKWNGPVEIREALVEQEQISAEDETTSMKPTSILHG